MDRNHLQRRDGDHINAVLAVAGYNFSLLLRSLRAAFCVPSSVRCSPSRSGSKPPKECSSMVLDQIGNDHNADFSYLEQHRNTEASPTAITAV